MSLSTILKNVFTFGNILAQSSTEAVKHWDNRSLENAFNWANYCEKVTIIDQVLTVYALMGSSVWFDTIN